MIAAHRRFLELAAASIDFELSARERDELARHLEACRACTHDLMALRADARMFSAMPLLARPRAGQPWAVRRPRREGVVRVLAVAALLLLAVGLATVAGGLILRLQTINPPESIPSAPVPSQRPSPVVSVSPPGPPAALRAVRVDGSSLGTVTTAVSTADTVVAFGSPACAVDSEGAGSCTVPLWTSPDGSRWTRAVGSDVFDVGLPGPGGPTLGIADSAAGAQGVAAVGYAPNIDCTDALCPPIATVWTSRDGAAWTAAAGVLGDVARPHAIAAYRSGWVIVGETYLQAGPRATVWISEDGVTWAAVADGPAFDIGGYLDTGEGAGSGGIADVVARDERLVAVGRRCDAIGQACEVAIWTSSDGSAWATEPSATGFGGLRAVAARPEGFVALGSLCGDEACPAGSDRAAGFWSADGDSWNPVDLDVPIANSGVASVAAGPAFTAVVQTETGSSVILYASHDGATWTPVEGPLEIEGALVIGNVATAIAPDGATLVIGSAELDRDPGTVTFVFRISAPR